MTEFAIKLNKHVVMPNKKRDRKIHTTKNTKMPLKNMEKYKECK